MTLNIIRKLGTHFRQWLEYGRKNSTAATHGLTVSLYCLVMQKNAVFALVLRNSAVTLLTRS